MLCKVIGISELKGELWTEGGIHAGKGRKLGSCPLSVRSAQAKWSGGVAKLMITAQVTNGSGGGSRDEEELMFW